MSDWQPIETAPKDGTWFVALPKSEHGFNGVSYPPTVCQVTGERFNFHTEDYDGYDITCKAMNTASGGWELSDFTHWAPLPAPPENDQ